MNDASANDKLTPTKSKNKSEWVVNVVLAVFFLAGCSIMCLGLYYFYYGKTSQTWPTCIGTVTKSEVGRYSGSRRGSKSFIPDITYSYTVSEQQYTGDRYAFGNRSFSKRNDAQKIVDEYPINSKVTVYYSLNHPETSVLQPGVQSKAWYCCIIGAVVSAFSLLLLLPIPQVPREQDRSEPIITPS